MSERSPLNDELQRLVALLASADGAEGRDAGDQLLARGLDAVEPLRACLQTGAPKARRSAAFLLGRLPPSPEAVAGLLEALSQEDPRLKRIAAESLGRLGDPDSVAGMSAALEREERRDVRASLLLALGRIGGEEAQASVRALEVEAPEVEAARRKALDRNLERAELAWAAEAPPWPLVARLPVGLEDMAVQELEAQELAFSDPGGGMVTLLEHPAGLLARLRCAYELRLLLARVPAPGNWRNALRKVDRLLRKAEPESWGSVLTGGPLRYRLGLEGAHVDRATVGEALRQARAVLGPLGITDSPSAYGLRLVLERRDDFLSAWLVPTFEGDARFAYRQADVGASIHPVIAAGLARLVRRGGEGTVLDPTCGSGTLLVERGMLDPGMQLRGVEISPTGFQAACTNLAAAGMDERARLRRGNAANPASWSDCDEVIANLPFGLRSEGGGVELAKLYRSVVHHAGRHLREGGRAVLYSTRPQLVEEAVASSGQLRRIHRRVVQAGGLDVGVWLFGPVPPTR